MASLPLPRFLEKASERRHHAANLGRALTDQPTVNLAERKVYHDPADALSLRGIPAIGRGVAGVIRGTAPGVSG